MVPTSLQNLGQGVIQDLLSVELGMEGGGLSVSHFRAPSGNRVSDKEESF